MEILRNLSVSKSEEIEITFSNLRVSLEFTGFFDWISAVGIKLSRWWQNFLFEKLHHAYL